MYEQPYLINEFARTAAALVSGFAKLREQLVKCGEFYSLVQFFELIPEVLGRLQSRDMNADVGGQVPEDGVVGLGFAAQPFAVALERLDLRFEACLNGSLPHRPDKVRFHQGVDVCRNGFGVVLEQTVGTLEVARHDIPHLPGFEIGGHKTFPGREVVASCQRLDGRDGPLRRVVDQSRHGGACESGVDR